jgi:hypothetical protein
MPRPVVRSWLFVHCSLRAIGVMPLASNNGGVRHLERDARSQASAGESVSPSDAASHARQLLKRVEDARGPLPFPGFMEMCACRRSALVTSFGLRQLERMVWNSELWLRESASHIWM